MVGSQSAERLEKDGANLVKSEFGGENSVDITDKAAVETFFREHDFKWAVLFSAFTDVNGAESQRGDKNGSCWKINVDGVRNITDSCQKYGRKLIFISTDFIFDGASGPYSEENPAGPDLEKVGWYGITKIEGEKLVRESIGSEDFLILRISFPYSGASSAKEDFLIKTINLFKSGSLYPMYEDQTITPTYIPDVAGAILALLKNRQSGIFHLGSPDTVSPYDFAKHALFVLTHKQQDVEKGSLGEALKKPGAVPRPLRGGMRVVKINKFFRPTGWEEGIEKALQAYTRSQNTQA
jgi:dTDP-4-dehydrorhamnose reductase